MVDEEPVTAEDWNRRVIQEFRANGGKVGGQFEGATLALLTCVGARSGRSRTNPVWYMPDGERVLIFATNAGAPDHPGWYHNVLANPDVTIEVGTETYPARAVPVTGSERDTVYARAEGLSPVFTEYQSGVSRTIPAVAIYRHAS